MNAKEYSFRPTGQTHVIPADATAPTGVQVVGNSSSGAQNNDCYLLYNSGSVVIHLGWGPTAAKAQSNAVAAAAGSPSNAFPIPAGAGAVFRFAKDVFFSGLSASAASLFITPGEGV